MLLIVSIVIYYGLIPVPSLEMMMEIVPNPDIFVMQVEMDLYSLAKKVLKISPTHTHRESSN